MPLPLIQRPDLPEYLTWEELELLPEEIAGQIELWNGRVVWAGHRAEEHRVFTRRLTNTIEHLARQAMSERDESCWRVDCETNVFLGTSGRSDFSIPSFLIHRCLETPDQDIRAQDVLLVGEVMCAYAGREGKRGRYAHAGIPWYWEVALDRESSAIEMVRANVLSIGHAQLPDGARPLRPNNYIAAGEWTHENPDGIAIDFPFPITIPWTELEY
ncbi:Uma2 family endonuclease [Nocardia sp. NPDC052278]|uniref:Uma2 family endonuclease n=1 Tax=unclassified Nocardia TaxID=2637762 RepID=UPI0036A06606